LEEDEITYGNIVDAIRKKDGKLFKFTVETDPNYGKYHFDGHRVCSFSCSPEQTKRLNGFCPRCKRRLTIGVLSRVEQLADRPEGFVPKDAIPFKDLIPLYEIISFTMGVEQLYSKKVLDEQNKLIDRFGNEFNVLLKVSKEELVKVTHEKIADSIVRLREGKVKFVAGYDGVYGKPIFGSGENLKDKITGMKIQSSLTDFNAKGP
jgi:PHP family Zn ribbon phosphoesterase